MKVTATLDKTFIPEFNGNRELPAGEQITVEIKRPTVARRSSLKSIRATQAGDFSFSYETDRILRQNVGKIVNLESEVNGETVVITDGRALAENTNPALEELATEICMEITRGLELDEDEVKN